MRRLVFIALVACGHGDETAPPPPAPVVPAPAKVERPACDHEGPIPAGVLRCRELPFELALEAAFVRTDASPTSTLAASFPDGTRWQVQIQALLKPVTDEQIAGRLESIVKLLEPLAKLPTKRGPRIDLVAPNGERLIATGAVHGGFLVTLAATQKIDASPTEQARTERFLAALSTREPPVEGDVPLALSSGTVMIPARAWRFTSFAAEPKLETRSALFAIADLHATLGIRELIRPERCAQLTTTEPRAFIDSLAVGSLTIDTIERRPDLLHVITKDDRPAAYDMICRRGMLVQITVRANALTPALLQILDRASASLR